MTQNNTIVTLQIDDEERGSELLAPYRELHGDDASRLHQVAPTLFSAKLVFMSSSSSLQRFSNMEYDIRLTVAPPLTSILEIGLPSM
jgi:hypothetical protein